MQVHHVVAHSQLLEVTKADFHLVTATLCKYQQRYVSCVFEGVCSILLDVLDMPESEPLFDWSVQPWSLHLAPYTNSCNGQKTPPRELASGDMQLLYAQC